MVSSASSSERADPPRDVTRTGTRSPRVSVVTVCFNAAPTIEQTILSVLGQKDVGFEYVVIDGASTDGTLAILERYRDRIGHLVSEKDAGIFDAMNKGVALATGEVLYFLGADDTFVDEHVLHDVAQVFSEDPDRLLVYGDVVLVDAPDGVRYSPAKPFKTWSISEFLGNSFCHQALFARRSLFDAVGLFDTRRRYSADYEWVIKVFRQKPRGFFHMPRMIANYYFQGRSFTQADSTRKEVRTYYFKHLLSFEMLWFFARYVLLRGWKKKLFGEQW